MPDIMNNKKLINNFQQQKNRQQTYTGAKFLRSFKYKNLLKTTLLKSMQTMTKDRNLA